MAKVELHTRPPASLSDCAHEQIHIPGTIQSFGALVVFDRSKIITRVSANIEELAAIAPSELVGKSINKLISSTDMERLRNAVKEMQRTHVALPSEKGRNLSVVIKSVGDETMIEFLPIDATFDTTQAIQQFVAGISDATTEADLAQAITDGIRSISGFDRVKLYKFDSQWNGEVIAESRRADVPSYKGLHFPESDIPKQARELYVRNKVRVIGDVDDPQFSIIQKVGLEPLDMSFSFVRSVSPIHLQYLRNMDVRASMSISVFHKTKFWGLIACHHQSARIFYGHDEKLYRTISALCSSKIASVLEAEAAAEQARIYGFLQNLLPICESRDPEKLLHDGTRLDELIRATGLALYIDGRVYKRNSVPDDQTLLRLVEWLDQGMEKFFYCDDLPSRFGQSIGSYAAGILAVCVPGPVKVWVMWFRMELVNELSWAGDPYTPKTGTEFGERLYPRTSFAIWKETKRGRAAPWSANELSAATSLCNLLSRSKLIGDASSNN